MKVSDLRRHERRRGALSRLFSETSKYPNLKEEKKYVNSLRRETDLFGDLTEKLGFFLVLRGRSRGRSFVKRVVASFTVNISVRLLVYFGLLRLNIKSCLKQEQ